MVLRSYTQEHPSKPPYHCSKKGNINQSNHCLHTFLLCVYVHVCVLTCTSLKIIFLRTSKNSTYSEHVISVLSSGRPRPPPTKRLKSAKTAVRVIGIEFISYLCKIWGKTLSKIDYRIFLITLLVFFFSGRTSF